LDGNYVIVLYGIGYKRNFLIGFGFAKVLNIPGKEFGLGIKSAGKKKK
jgi:hypothetical protein